MGWAIHIRTDKEIRPEDVEQIVNQYFFGASKQKWGWSAEVDVWVPRSNVQALSGAFFSYNVAIANFLKMVKGLKERGYQVQSVSADEGLDELIKQMGYNVPREDETGPSDIQTLEPGEKSSDDWAGSSGTPEEVPVKQGKIEPEGEPKKIEDNLKDMDDKGIVKYVYRRIKDKKPLKSDEILAIYDIAKERKSNLLVNLVKQLGQELREQKNTTLMKTELMESLVRACVNEVLDQMQASPSNANEFHRDQQGMWCKTCGNKGRVAKLPNGDTVLSCDNTTCPAYKSLMRRGRLEEGDEADAMSDQDQESQANRDDKDREKRDKKVKIKIKPEKVSLKIGEQDSDAMAPPAAGQGTGDAPAIPKEEPPKPPQEEPEEPEEEPEEVPQDPMAALKGIQFVNPRNKAKVVNKSKFLRPGDDRSLETALYNIGAEVAGSRVKVANSTMRLVKSALQSPGSSLYLYLGKYDPDSEEIYLMADKSLQVAKDSSVPPTEITGTPVSALQPGAGFNPRSATDAELIRRQRSGRAETGGMTPRYGIDEKLRRTIRKMVTEVLDRT